MFLVLRVLFELPADTGRMPDMRVGAPWPALVTRQPRFPIMLEDDVPLLLVSGYHLSGIAQQPESHVNYFRSNGQVRTKPLVPSNVPLSLLGAASKKLGMVYEKDEGKILITNQLLHLIESVYRPDVGWRDLRFWAEADVDKRWKALEDEVARLDIRWNPEKACYTFKDGSHLPEPVQELYRRAIWKLDGMNGESELILERMSPKTVWVTLTWSGKTDPGPPQFSLNLFTTKDQAKALAEFRQVSLGAQAAGTAYSSQGFEVELVQGTEVQARITIGMRVQMSQAYKP